MEKKGREGLKRFTIVTDNRRNVIWSRRVTGTLSAYQVTINGKNSSLIPLDLAVPDTNLPISSLLISMCFESFLFILVSITNSPFPDRAHFRIYFHKMSQNGYSFNDDISHRYFISKKKNII